MIEIIGEPREATEEELQEMGYEQKEPEKPEWQQKMMNNFLRRPKSRHCQPDCFGASTNDCGRCLK